MDVAPSQSLPTQRLVAAFQWHTDEVGYMQDLSGIYSHAGLLAELGRTSLRACCVLQAASGQRV